MLENLPIPLWTLPTFCVSSVLMTYAAYKRYKKYGESRVLNDLIIANLSIVAAVAMWIATISLTIGCFVGGAWLAWGPLFGFVLGVSYPLSSFLEANKKVSLAPFSDAIEPGSFKSISQANVRWWVEVAGMIFSALFVSSFTSPATACYLAFVSCQIIWNFGLTREFKNRVKGCFGLGKERLISDQERLRGVEQPEAQRLPETDYNPGPWGGLAVAPSLDQGAEPPSGFVPFQGTGQRLGA